jgi:hypothetical protein
MVDISKARKWDTDHEEIFRYVINILQQNDTYAEKPIIGKAVYNYIKQNCTSEYLKVLEKGSTSIDKKVRSILKSDKEKEDLAIYPDKLAEKNKNNQVTHMNSINGRTLPTQFKKIALKYFPCTTFSFKRFIGFRHFLCSTSVRFGSKRFNTIGFKIFPLHHQYPPYSHS